MAIRTGTVLASILVVSAGSDPLSPESGAQVRSLPDYCGQECEAHASEIEGLTDSPADPQYRLHPGHGRHADRHHLPCWRLEDLWLDFQPRRT